MAKFSLYPTLTELYPSRQNAEVAEKLGYLLEIGGIGLVIGDIGAGKTMAVQSFVAGLDLVRYKTIPLTAPLLSTRALARELVRRLGLEPRQQVGDLLQQYHDAVFGLAKQGKKIFILLDEAQDLPASVILNLRTLPLGPERSPGALCLIGPSSLEERLRLSAYEAVEQRVAVRYRLPGFSLPEAMDYIREESGGAEFTPEALTRIFHHSRGLPRLLNHITRTSLQLAAKENRPVDEETVEAALAEMGRR